MRTPRSRPVPLRLLGTIAVTGLLVSFTPAAAQAARQPAPQATACRTVPLPIPDGTLSSSANGGDPTGRFLVGVGFSQGGATGLLWVHGRLTPIDQSSLAPYVQVQFNDVDRHGVIVGERTTDYSTFHTDAFIYRNGHFTLLPAPSPSEPTDAVAINSRGDIVGNAFGATGPQPVEWPADRPGTVRVLPTPDGGGFAADIDEDGTIVGYLAPWPPGTPYVWPATSPGHPLPVPAGSAGGNTAAIRLGMIAGDVFDPSTGATVPTLWNLHTGTTTMRPSVQGTALSVNRRGTLGTAGAIVHPDGSVIPISGWANILTDRGTAAGTTSEFTGQAVQFLNC